MKVLNVLVVILAVVAFVLSFLAFSRPGQVVVREILGAAGSTFSNRVDFLSGLSMTGLNEVDSSIPTINGVSAGSAVATSTALQICQNNILNVTISNASATLSLPTETDFNGAGCLENPGDVKVLRIRNATTTGNFTFLLGASSTLYGLEITSSTLASGSEYATTTVRAGRIAELTGMVITSSTDWIEWTLRLFGR